MKRASTLIASLALMLVVAAAPALADNADDDFAFLAVEDNGFFYELVITDGSGGSDRTPVDKPIISRPAFSPDGTKIAFSGAITDGTDGRWAIYVINADGSGLEQLTDPPLGDFDPAWSADGRWIAFSRNTEGNMDPDTCCVIMRMRSDGSQQQTVPGTLSGINPTWDPGGSRIAYERYDGVWVTTLDGVTAYRLAGGDAGEPAWSPNGARIAYTRTDGGNWQVVYEDAAGSAVKVRGSSNHRLESPVWDIDSWTLFYVRYSGIGYEGRANTSVRRDTIDAPPELLFADARDIVLLTHAARPELTCDIDNDGFSDVAIGAPNDDEPGPTDAGAINVLYGGAGGLGTAGNQLWHQGSNGVAGGPGAGDHFGTAIACADFDGDGFSDVAIGAPGNNGGRGEVNVLYGSASGLTAAGDQRWTQDSPNVQGAMQPGDAFGAALTAGDFDGDGFADLAVGVPGEDINEVVDAGAANVLYGTGNGLAATGNQMWKQDSPAIAGAGQTNDAFGSSLAAGDFDGDGADDLAIGVPNEDIGALTDMGVVNVIYGTGNGLAAARNKMWHQNQPNVEGSGQIGDRFGSAVATGDFDGDDRMDLAVGVPFEDINGITDAGAVNVLYGTGSGITAARDQLWKQDSPGIAGTGQAADQFGKALATGDVNGNGKDDIAVGVPRDLATKGAVNLILGTPSGLAAAGNKLWHQDTPGITGTGESGDRFGSAVTLGDYDGGGYLDLVAGVPFEGISGTNEAGAIQVIYGSAFALKAAGNQQWHQGSAGIAGTPAVGDAFGSTLR